MNRLFLPTLATLSATVAVGLLTSWSSAPPAPVQDPALHHTAPKVVGPVPPTASEPVTVGVGAVAGAVPILMVLLTIRSLLPSASW